MKNKTMKIAAEKSACSVSTYRRRLIAKIEKEGLHNLPLHMYVGTGHEKNYPIINKE